MHHQIEQKRLDDMREGYTFARSNKTSMPYNPINLRYDNGCAPPRGRPAERARARARARTLAARRRPHPLRARCSPPSARAPPPRSPDGERLRYSDESLRYRGALRAEHLQRRMTSTGYNPITGDSIERVHVPEAPTVPSDEPRAVPQADMDMGDER